MRLKRTVYFWHCSLNSFFYILILLWVSSAAMYSLISFWGQVNACPFSLVIWNMISVLTFVCTRGFRKDGLAPQTFVLKPFLCSIKHYEIWWYIYIFFRSQRFNIFHWCDALWIAKCFWKFPNYLDLSIPHTYSITMFLVLTIPLCRLVAIL